MRWVQSRMADLEIPEKRRSTYERTNRSRLTQSGFEGLKVMNLLNITWATGAMPIGAPGCPELALKVASIYRTVKSQRNPAPKA